MLPTLLNRFCNALDLPQEGRAPWLRDQLAERGVNVSRRTAYNWFQPDWVRPNDDVRPHLPKVFGLNKTDELELYRVISAGPVSPPFSEASDRLAS